MSKVQTSVIIDVWKLLAAKEVVFQFLIDVELLLSFLFLQVYLKVNNKILEKTISSTNKNRKDSNTSAFLFFETG